MLLVSVWIDFGANSALILVWFSEELEMSFRPAFGLILKSFCVFLTCFQTGFGPVSSWLALGLISVLNLA